MALTVEMPQEIEAQLLAEAQSQGVPLSDYVRDFILEHYQEVLEDSRIAQERLDDPQAALTSSQLRKRLGLDS